MQFTLATILAAISAVSAAPATGYGSAPAAPNGFTMMSLRSASPIHFGRVDASGGKFYIGLSKPSSYCPTPPVPASSCPPGNSTVISFGSTGTAGLKVIVPGGQQVYVAPDNSLSYTGAHSAWIPTGSTVDGFSLGKKQSNTLRTISHSKGGFLACPAKANTGPWKVFVGSVKNKDAPSGKACDCLGFSNNAIEFPNDQYGAWQY